MNWPEWTSPDGRIRLINADCLEVLPHLDGIEAVVTDPPYGIGFVYEDGQEVANDPQEYAAFLLPIVSHCKRVSKPGALFALWQAQLNYRHFWTWFGDGIHVYCAAKNFVQLRKTQINYAYDPVVMWYLPGDRKLSPVKPPRSVDFFVANTAAVVSDKTRLEKGHPCPRPLDAVIEVVNNFAAESGQVLDPFAGSGTTAIACVRTGRRCIAIEKDRKYWEIGIERCQREYQMEAVA